MYNSPNNSYSASLQLTTSAFHFANQINKECPFPSPASLCFPVCHSPTVLPRSILNPRLRT
ncbi:hypothetical protein DsansV1_C23g0177161 [Dioscorea sansibarensis]